MNAAEPGLGARAAAYRRAGGRGGGRGALELREPALQCPLSTGQSGDSPQVFPDFNKFRGMVLFLFWGFLQLKGREAEMRGGWARESPTQKPLGLDPGSSLGKQPGSVLPPAWKLRGQSRGLCSPQEARFKLQTSSEP